jgi:hypothetical protein
LETPLPLDGSLDQQRARYAGPPSRPPAQSLPHRCLVGENVDHPRVARSERGEGKLKAIMFLVIFIALVFVGFKTVPAYVAEYQLADKMQEVARYSVVNRQNEEQVRDAIFKVVQDLDIPATKEDIKVTSTNSLVTINVDYRVPVDLMVYQTEIHFSPSSENKSLF